MFCSSRISVVCCFVGVLGADDDRSSCLVCSYVGVWVFLWSFDVWGSGGSVFVFFRYSYFAGAIELCGLVS